MQFLANEINKSAKKFISLTIVNITQQYIILPK
jgi:hypothetical protein